jgi:hypothetical protein
MMCDSALFNSFFPDLRRRKSDNRAKKMDEALQYAFGQQQNSKKVELRHRSSKF